MAPASAMRLLVVSAAEMYTSCRVTCPPTRISISDPAPPGVAPSRPLPRQLSSAWTTPKPRTFWASLPASTATTGSLAYDLDHSFRTFSDFPDDPPGRGPLPRQPAEELLLPRRI